MAARYIERTLETTLGKAVREFPAVVVTGARQSGKTTLLKHLFAKSHRYVSLEPPDTRAAAYSDPRGFLDFHAPPVIFDEVQYASELLPYIKERIDGERGKRGQYLLTGSQNLLMLEKVTESLAGRAAILRLLPLTRAEEKGRPALLLPWETGRKTGGRPFRGRDTRAFWQSMLRGGYPELVAGRPRDFSLWHASYIQTYLERDVRGLRQVGDLTSFQIFLRTLAARSAQLLNMTGLARELGIAVNTVKSWLSILEATYQVIILRPYFANIGKRLVKTPKVYFTDLGTLCYLAGIHDVRHLVSGPMAGAVFETAAVMEIIKTIIHNGREPGVYFWRTASGVEVDIVVEHEGRLVPVEVKQSSTLKPAMASGILAFREAFREKADKGYLVYPGAERAPLVKGVEAVPFSDL